MIKIIRTKTWKMLLASLEVERKENEALKQQLNETKGELQNLHNIHSGWYRKHKMEMEQLTAELKQTRKDLVNAKCKLYKATKKQKS